MIILDQIFKNSIARVAQSYPRSVIQEIVQAHQVRFDYIIRVLAAPRPLQMAIRDAAIADTGEFPQQLAAILTAWLSPALQGPAVTQLGPGAILAPLSPPITINAVDTSLFLPSGSFRFNSGKIINYTGKTGTTFTGCTSPTTLGGLGSGGSVITQVGAFPSAAEASAKRDLFKVAFTRRSQNAMGALTFINEKHIWSWNLTP